jgi:serpin B
LEMPYEGQFCMGFILPQLIVQPEFMADLASKSHDKTNVRVRIPKFTQRKNIDLIPILRCLGINDLFTSNAKLDDICEGIYVSNMLHEAVVIVDEKGTEASATTVAICVTKCMHFEEEPQATFNANHPFVYYIKYVPTKTIMFVGCYDG